MKLGHKTTHVVAAELKTGLLAASTGKAIAQLDGADLAAARAEALGHIRAYSRRQRSWFRKLGASRVDHRSAVKTIVSRLQ